MNLWGRLAGSTFLALIFIVACQDDETSLLGFKGASNKFQVAYTEVDVPTAVMAIDSLRTYNIPSVSAGRRILVGKYVDNNFGELTAEAYTQFAPITPIVNIPETAELVSGYLTLSFDFYNYGGPTPTTESFTVHELLDSIPSNSISQLPLSVQRVPTYNTLYFNSNFSYNSTPIGTGSFSVNPFLFDRTLDDMANNPDLLDHKTIDTLKIDLSQSFTSALFEAARNQTTDYTVQTRFRRIFKGIVIRPDASNSKIIGFNPDIDTTTYSKSKIVLNYDEIDPDSGEKTRKRLEYSILKLSASSFVLGFSRITADRGATALASLPGPSVPVELDGNRYYQSGNPVVTTVNFSEFLTFADKFPNLVLNSVQLTADVEDADNFDPPSSLRLRYLNSSNEFVSFFSNIPSQSGLPLYPTTMTYDEEGWFVIGQRSGSTNIIAPFYDIVYDAENKRYSADLTDFFQTLYDVKDEELRYTDFAFVASSPLIGLSVNRMIFNKDNIKLKIFYTIPLVDNN
ncbi:MAG: DUF4270 family protein [Cyclobacteriaceae bacterium]